MGKRMLVVLVVLVLASHAWAGSPRPVRIEDLRAQIAALEKENVALKETVRVQGVQIVALLAQMKRLATVKQPTAQAPPQATLAPLPGNVVARQTLDSDAVYWTPEEHMTLIPAEDQSPGGTLVICEVCKQVTGVSVGNSRAMCEREQALGILKSDPESNPRIKAKVTSIWQGCSTGGNNPDRMLWSPIGSTGEMAFATMATRVDKTELGKTLIRMYVQWLMYANDPRVDNAETCHARLAALATAYDLDAIRETWKGLTVQRAKELWAQQFVGGGARNVEWTAP